MKWISNSFNYTISKVIKIDTNKRHCIMLDHLQYIDPIRTIGIYKNKKIYIYHTDTKDFDNEQLAWTKYEKGQIYKQKDSSIVIDDFRKQLIKLNMHPTCQKCVYKFSCSNIWIEEKKNIFEESEKIVRKILRQMRGEILDIGCGSINLYEKILIYLSKNNRINYTGIDPDSESIRMMAKRYLNYKNIRFFNTNIERYRDNKKFDYILLLRSINHIKDTEGLFTKIKQLIKDNGRLLIVDNIPFGVVRKNKRYLCENKKDIKKVQFEHYHNYDAVDLLTVISDYKMIVNRIISVDISSANQWLIDIRNSSN